MEKKLMKIRMRPDGTWEHVYTDGTTDQEFYQLDAYELAAMYMSERDRKMQEYMLLQDLKDNIIEEVIEHRGMPDAAEVINRIKNL